MELIEKELDEARRKFTEAWRKLDTARKELEFFRDNESRLQAFEVLC